MTQAPEDTPNALTVTLKFHRFLSESEWRAVIDAARRVPYVVELEARAVKEVPRRPPAAPPDAPEDR